MVEHSAPIPDTPIPPEVSPPRKQVEELVEETLTRIRTQVANTLTEMRFQREPVALLFWTHPPLFGDMCQHHFQRVPVVAPGGKNQGSRLVHLLKMSTVPVTWDGEEQVLIGCFPEIRCGLCMRVMVCQQIWVLFATGTMILTYAGTRHHLKLTGDRTSVLLPDGLDMGWVNVAIGSPLF